MVLEHLVALLHRQLYELTWSLAPKYPSNFIQEIHVENWSKRERPENGSEGRSSSKARCGRRCAKWSALSAPGIRTSNRVPDSRVDAPTIAIHPAAITIIGSVSIPIADRVAGIAKSRGKYCTEDRQRKIS